MNIDPSLEDCRLLTGQYKSPRGAPYGAFTIPGPCGRELTVMAADAQLAVAQGWEHVSVSTKTRTPNWKEMAFIKKLFWRPNDCVMQFHVPADKHINIHPYTLHMWRYTRGEFPMPPVILV